MGIQRIVKIGICSAPEYPLSAWISCKGFQGWKGAWIVALNSSKKITFRVPRWEKSEKLLEENHDLQEPLLHHC
jgi:hypothetical protein